MIYQLFATNIEVNIHSLPSNVALVTAYLGFILIYRQRIIKYFHPGDRNSVKFNSW